MLLFLEWAIVHHCILKRILVLGEVPTQEFDDTTIKAEAKYSINFTRSKRKFCLNLNYNKRNSLLFANSTKMYQFLAKNSEMKRHPFCLENI